VGNLYFSAWAGFLLSFMVFGSVLKEFLGVGGGAASSSAAASGQSEGECTGSFQGGLGLGGLLVCSRIFIAHVSCCRR